MLWTSDGMELCWNFQSEVVGVAESFLSFVKVLRCRPERNGSPFIDWFNYGVGQYI